MELHGVDSSSVDNDHLGELPELVVEMYRQLEKVIAEGQRDLQCDMDDDDELTMEVEKLHEFDRSLHQEITRCDTIMAITPDDDVDFRRMVEALIDSDETGKRDRCAEDDDELQREVERLSEYDRILQLEFEALDTVMKNQFNEKDSFEFMEDARMPPSAERYQREPCSSKNATQCELGESAPNSLMFYLVTIGAALVWSPMILVLVSIQIPSYFSSRTRKEPVPLEPWNAAADHQPKQHHQSSPPTQESSDTVMWTLDYTFSVWLVCLMASLQTSETVLCVPNLFSDTKKQYTSVCPTLMVAFTQFAWKWRRLKLCKWYLS